MVPGLKMRVLFGIKAEPLWVEAQACNLHYLREGIKMSLDRASPGRKRKAASLAAAAADEDPPVDAEAVEG